MPYLPTSQAFLEQSSLLLEAYPAETRITTKYSYPTSNTSKKSASEKSEPPQTQTPSTAPIATLTLKTYNPATGICLKYRTNKAAEVGRLISGLGKLASGAKISSTDEAAATAVTTGGDVEMTDVGVATTAQEEKTGAAAGGSSGGGGKKKKSGKGKR